MSPEKIAAIAAKNLGSNPRFRRFGKAGYYEAILKIAREHQK